jgi:hypothetical protein
VRERRQARELPAHFFALAFARLDDALPLLREVGPRLRPTCVMMLYASVPLTSWYVRRSRSKCRSAMM